MSSTIHSLGPKSANGLSCEVCCVDTAALDLFPEMCASSVGSGYALKHVPGPSAPAGVSSHEVSRSTTRLTPAGSRRTRPAFRTCGSADVALTHDHGADQAGHHPVPEEHEDADPPGGRLWVRLRGGHRDP